MEPADLTILPIKPDGTEMRLKREIHPNLPPIQSGQFGIVIAKVKSGKSTLISNLLLSKHFYKDLFDMVYIISNTINNDRTSRFLKEAFPCTCYDRYDDEIIKNIVEYQESFKSKKEQPFIAVICDDFAGIKKSSAIWNFITRFRHYNCGLVLQSVQGFKLLPPVARNNATFCLFGKNTNQKELSKICDEYADIYGGEQNFLRLFHQATEGQYNWLYLNLNENPPHAYRNFTDRIWDGNHTQQSQDRFLLASSSSDENCDSTDDD
jgi:hypothetical protein